MAPLPVSPPDENKKPDEPVLTRGIEPRKRLKAAAVPRKHPLSKQANVANLLRQEILSGTIKPEQRITQEEIARRLGTSWTPVREAFRRLEAEGWIRIETHRGAIVTPLSLKDFEEIYQLRLMVQPEAVRRTVEKIDSKTLAGLEEVAKQLEELDLNDTSERETFLALSYEFYRGFYQAGGNLRLAELVMSLRDAADRYVRASFRVPTEAKRHLQVMRQLLELCTLKDSTSAAEVMRDALLRVRSVVRSILIGQNPGEFNNIQAGRKQEDFSHNSMPLV